VLIPEGFPFTEAEVQKCERLASMLKSDMNTTSNLLVFLLHYVQKDPRGFQVVKVPEVLAPFPVKWGYKKKRNDFLKLLIDLDFIYVKMNYWARIRPKRYALSNSGQELVERLAECRESDIPPPYPGSLPGAQTLI